MMLVRRYARAAGSRLAATTGSTPDFTALGVLPFLQYRINLWCQHKATNVVPTDEQHGLFTSLARRQNVLVKSNVQSGKSFAMLVYLINRELLGADIQTGVPKTGTSSVVVVPTDTLLLKYRAWALLLIAEIEPECCPTMVRNSEEDLEVERAPLALEFVDSTLQSSLVSTSSEKSTPQIAVVTAGAFRAIVNESGILDTLLKREDLLQCLFLGVDEATFLLSAASAGSAPNFVKVGKKNKMELTLVKSIKQLRKLKVEAAAASKRVPPLQFCFLFHAQHPLHLYFNKISNGVNVLTGEASKYDHPEELLVQKLLCYSREEEQLYGEQDSLVSIGSFNSEHFYRHQQNQVEKRVKLGLASMVSRKGNPVFVPVDPSFQETDTYSAMKAYGEELKFKANSKLKTSLKETLLSQKENTIKSGKAIGASLSLFRKTFNNEPVLIVVPPYIKIDSSVKQLNSKEPTVGYRPTKGLQDCPMFAYSGNTRLQPESYSYKLLTDFFLENNKNLVMSSSELPGIDMPNIKNIILFGSVLAPTLATSTSLDAELVPGIELPYTDLTYYYLLKLQMHQDSGDRNVLYVHDSYLTAKNQERIEHMILYNDLANLVDLVNIT